MEHELQGPPSPKKELKNIVIISERKCGVAEIT
jgi:hypothetical protein